VPGGLEQPVGDDDDRHQLVDGEVDPSDVRVELFLEPRQQKREDDSRDRDVERDCPAHGVEGQASLLAPDDDGERDIAIAKRFVWMVKKLKKFPVLKRKVGELSRYENW